MKTAKKQGMACNPVESLADYIYDGYKDEVEMIYATKKGLIRDLEKNIRLLEAALSSEDLARLKKSAVAVPG